MREQKPGLEYIHGTVHRKSMGNDVHSFLQSQLAARLTIWRGPEHGFTVTEQRCILQVEGESHIVLPDVAWFSREQVPALKGGPMHVAPLLAIEILSPDDVYSEVQEKVLVYLGAGVSVVWVVDPRGRRVSIYRPGQPPVLSGSADVLTDAWLPDLSIPLSELFAWLPCGPQPPSE
ncbi:MAG: Uma2 family endonuclease [Candidatus Xenobia bacterium]